MLGLVLTLLENDQGDPAVAMGLPVITPPVKAEEPSVVPLSPQPLSLNLLQKNPIPLRLPLLPRMNFKRHHTPKKDAHRLQQTRPVLLTLPPGEDPRGEPPWEPTDIIILGP